MDRGGLYGEVLDGALGAEHALPASGAEKYTGQQRATALVQELRGQEDGRVEGTFAFSAAPENPGVPSGSYRVEGSLSPGMVSRLDGREWIQQPQDYVSVPLVGRMDLAEARYHGFVDAPDRESFSVTLQR